MNILLLGGTGAMGVHLTKILSENTNNKVFVTSRKERNSNKENIHFIAGNAKEDDFLDSILKKEEWDCIVDFMVYTTEEFKNRSQKLLSSCSQYVFLSSSRVYADSATPITEDSPRLLDVCKDETYLKTDEYGLTKARQENILFESGRKNFTIIRPYITYSENRLQLGVLEKETWLFTALNCEALVFSKDIASHTTTLTYGFDVARGIAAIIGKKEAYGQAFHITGNRSIKWQEVFDLYAKVLKENGVNFEPILKEKTHRLDYEASKYQVIYDRYFDRVFDNSKIAKFIDIESFVKPEEGLKNCLEAFIKKPEFNFVNSREIVSILNNTGHKLSISRISGFKQKLKLILLKLILLIWRKK